MKIYKLSALLFWALTAKADIVSITFSGVWDKTAGAAIIGESFSGSAQWDSDLGFSSPAQFSISLFPQLTSIYVQTNMEMVKYFSPAPYSAAACSPSNPAAGPVFYYLMTISATHAEVICKDSALLSQVAEARSPSYQYSFTQPPSNVSTVPEPKYGFFAAFLVLLLNKRILS